MADKLTFDVALEGTIHVTGMDLGEAVERIRNLLQGHGLDVTLADGIVLHQVSLYRPAHTLVYASGDGPDAPEDDGTVLDDMDEPHACDNCRTIYDEARGEGYCGLCGQCADAGVKADGEG